jgi:MoaA/NifB/PqqE/SkfB family radical SAM enzyme
VPARAAPDGNNEGNPMETTATGALMLDPGLRFRFEHFGALAWRTAPKAIFRLGAVASRVALLHEQPRSGGLTATAARAAGVPVDSWPAVRKQLHTEGVLIRCFDKQGSEVTPAEAGGVADRIARSTPRWQVLRPFWAHLQPFTRCNQLCVHCYCQGGPAAAPLLLPVETWREIIGDLDHQGVFDVFVTGGESLMEESFFVLAEEILDRGMGFGVSTNATVLSDAVFARLAELRIDAVQVSLDGATAATHERIRGQRGAFPKTVEGIARIRTIAEPVINTVVNAANLPELEDVVRLGRDLGCSRFKFFPQKPVGRSLLATGPAVLTDEQIMGELVPLCGQLASAYDVWIETIDPAAPCGSGTTGFAVDQNADVYPCIFGVANPRLRCGNLLTDGLDQLWFDSPIMQSFRGEVSTPCRRCER